MLTEPLKRGNIYKWPTHLKRSVQSNKERLKATKVNSTDGYQKQMLREVKSDMQSPT